VWAYDVGKPAVRQVSHFKDADVKSLRPAAEAWSSEQDGYLQTLDTRHRSARKLTVTVATATFPGPRRAGST
jgi:hypothetical protein